MFRFKDKFLSRLRILETQPFAFGNLTVRSLLDMREHCLMEFDFHDVYLKQKQLENKAAMSLLPSYLDTLRNMQLRDRHEALALGKKIFEVLKIFEIAHILRLFLVF